jgi:hypothetical protein
MRVLAALFSELTQKLEVFGEAGVSHRGIPLNKIGDNVPRQTYRSNFDTC